VSFAEALPSTCGDRWSRAARHPFVEAVADGTLPEASFDVWIQQDHAFVTGLEWFVRELISAAPAEHRAGLEGGLAALEPELQLFRDHAARRGITLDVTPSDICAGYLEFLRGSFDRSYAHALVAYYGCERVYLEAWTSVRERADGGRYDDWVRNWSSAAFRGYVDLLGGFVDAAVAASDPPIEEGATKVFADVVDFEIAFWDTCRPG
jgi:thiaminase/transcriptional activator TenA